MMSEYLNTKIFEIGGTSINLGTAIVFVVIVLTTMAIAKLLEKLVERGLNKRAEADPGTVGVTRRLVYYFVLLSGLAMGLQTIGIHLSALFAAGAVFAVAAGFALQNITQNFVSGVILLLERTIKPSDILEVNGEIVRVEKMGIRATVARTREEEAIIIPNSDLVQDAVKNYTLRDSTFRIRATVGVAYDSDLDTVEEVLTRVSESFEDRLQSPQPVVLLRRFDDSSVTFEASVWIQDPWRAPRNLSELYKKIWRAFHDQGITIAFPQLDLHVDSELVEALRHHVRAA